MSHSPDLIAMIATRSAVAPVAQALATLNTGMPVWPICFWSGCPMPAAALMRWPAARTPMSFMVTPPSLSAPRAASDARSMVSLSGCFPNFVMSMPRMKTSSLAIGGSFQRLEAEAHGLGALRVRANWERREADLHAQLHVVGVGRRVDDVAAHAGAAAVDHAGDERDRDTRRRERHDRVRLELTLGGDGDLLEVGATARCARVAAIEEAGAAGGALVGHEVRVRPEHQVVNQRDLFGHCPGSYLAEQVNHLAGGCGPGRCWRTPPRPRRSRCRPGGADPWRRCARPLVDRAPPRSPTPPAASWASGTGGSTRRWD